MLAREVFDKHLKYGLIEVPPGQSVNSAFNNWRHEEQARVLKGARDSLTEARQKDYRPLMRHFLTLQGGESAGRAFALAQKDTPRDEHARQLIFQLRKLAGAAGFNDAYLAGISGDKFGSRDFEQLEPRQLVQLIATVRRRYKARLAAVALG